MSKIMIFLIFFLNFVGPSFFSYLITLNNSNLILNFNEMDSDINASHIKQTTYGNGAKHWTILIPKWSCGFNSSSFVITTNDITTSKKSEW